MTARKSWAVSASPGGEVTTLDGRHAIGAAWWPGSGTMGKRAGRLPRGASVAWDVTATTPTPNGFVHVGAGHMLLMGTRSIAPYIATIDATEDINILATPADPSFTRWDLIVGQQNDTLHADANNTFTVRHVVGTPAASPADPAVTGSPDYVVIARVVVGPGVTSIAQANITQLLVDWTVAVGGLLPVADQAGRDALTGTRYDGMHIWRMDRDWIEAFDGSNWKVLGVAVCSSTADRDAAITTPYNGQLAITTDTGIMWQRQAGVWREYPSPPVANVRQSAVQSIPHQVWTSVTMGAEDIDSANGHSTVTNTSRYAASRGGTFLLGGGVCYAVEATGQRYTRWAKNGVALNGSATSLATGGSAVFTNLPARTMLVTLAAGDYVELQTWQNISSGLALNTGATAENQSSMSVTFVGP